LNYRHIFHAGNFADLVKHACLTAILARLLAAPARLVVIDTHAGAGVYDLASEAALKSGEAQAGIVRLLADPAAPAVFAALKGEVERLNPSGDPRTYPGSPLLIAKALRAGDQFLACELRPDDFAALERTLAQPGARALHADGYAIAAERVPSQGPVLVLIDPPFERADDYAAVLGCVDGVLRRNSAACILVWLPLKDLETFDAFLRGLETMRPPRILVAETRLRPLHDPMRLNGCALVMITDPPGMERAAGEACDWAARTLGEAGGEARVWRL
jgi:23S rRNA (adenine2030-N6)-methyltransferase